MQTTLIFPKDNAQAVCLWHIVFNPCTRKMIPLHIAVQTSHTIMFISQFGAPIHSCSKYLKPTI